jgi:YD repeat-containing protein
MHNMFSKIFLRVLSGIGMKFVNALMLTTILFSNFTGGVQARADSKEASKLAKQVSTSVTKNIFNSSSFVRPESRIAEAGEKATAVHHHPEALMGERSVLATENSQVPANLIQCLSSECSNTTPGVSVTETWSSEGGNKTLYFKILCETNTWGCPKKDIYFHATLVVDWRTLYPRTGYSYLAGGTYYGIGTGSIAPPCGSGTIDSCTIETYGVIPAEIITPAPDAGYQGYHFYITGHGYGGDFGVAEAYSYAYTTINMEVSLDPHLLGLSVPDDTACKDCYYGQSQGFFADPINTRTGVMTYPVNDMQISTSAGALNFSHTYISSATSKFTAPLGYGWTHSQDIKLIFPSDPSGVAGFVLFKDTIGNIYRFFDTGQGRFTPYPGYTGALTINSGTPNTYTLRDQSQKEYLFNENGRLLTITNPDDTVVTYSYNTDGRLARVSADNSLHYLELGYDIEGRIATVSDHTNRVVTFGYNIQGDLETVIDVNNQTWRYEYDAHYLTRVVDPLNHQVQRTEYDLQNRAWRQWNGSGNLVAELTYNSDGSTTIADGSGKIITHRYNSVGVLGQQTDKE